MPRRRNVDDPPPRQSASPIDVPSRWMRVLAAVLLIGLVIVPMYVSWNGFDHFRQPKELLLYAVVIIAVAVAAIGLTLRHLAIDDASRQRLRIPAILAAAAVVWGLITTATSTNRALSIPALIWGASLIALFLLTAWVLRFVSMHVVALCIFIPGVVNATVLLLQAMNIWNPWVFEKNTHFRMTKNALLGNADDIGVYLAAQALFALALTLTVRRWRIAYGVVAAYMAAALAATETLTAIGAFAVAVPLLLIVWKPRTGLIAAAVLPFVFAAVMFFGPTRNRMEHIRDSIEAGRWGSIVTGRLVPYAAAWKMFTDRPLVGVGPGAFKFHYMRAYIQIREEHPNYFSIAGTIPANFGETHNDHLQTLAETGLPGYALLLAGVGFVALTSRRPRSTNERALLARTLAAPFTALLLVVMLAQFPLLIAATAYTYVTICGACLAWSTHDDAA